MATVDFGDTDGDLLSDPLANGGILQGGVLLAVRNKAKFQKRCRTFIVMEHVVTRELHSATV